MNRTLISKTVNKVGEEVILKGWVNSIRDHGKITFVDLRDRSGIVQVVVINKPTFILHPESVVEILGQVKARPEKLINPNLLTGTVEIEAKEIKLLASAAELPFDLDSTPQLQLPTLLDNRTLTLRHPQTRNIFLIQESILNNFLISAKELGCVQIVVPTISASSTEGGAEVFKIDYYGRPAFLTQSPQLYKQMLVPVFERVSVVAKIYRAEPSVTTRHLSESTQLDCELGFVDFNELLDAVEFVGRNILELTRKSHLDIFNSLGQTDLLLEKSIPRLTMRQAQEIIKTRTGVDHTQEPDLMPEDEREICRYAREEHGCDIVTITHYPTQKRAFYSLPDPTNPEFCLSFDLLFRGVEITSGAMRISNYDQLVTAIKNKGMNPENFSMYLSAFKYGMPPEGGFSFGLERLTMLLLGLDNVRQASLFPRDMERVDFRLN